MNYLRIHSFILATALCLAAPFVAAQAPTDNRVVVPLGDPTRPASVRAHLLNGSLTVKGADVKEVIVEARARHEEGRSRRESEEDRGERKDNRTQGMRHIPMTATGLNIEAENNQVRISADSVQRTVDLVITVPVHTSLSLHTVNDGNITVTGVDGEFDINNVNGEVDLKNIGGSVVAHALNGHVVVSFNRVDAKPMAFS